MDIKAVINWRKVSPKPLLFNVRTDIKIAALLNIVKNLVDVTSGWPICCMSCYLTDKPHVHHSILE
jgi:hypothetical protein